MNKSKNVVLAFMHAAINFSFNQKKLVLLYEIIVIMIT